MTTIDWTKPIAKLDGTPATIVYTDPDGDGDHRVDFPDDERGFYNAAGCRYFSDGGYTSAPQIRNYHKGEAPAASSMAEHLATMARWLPLLEAGAPGAADILRAHVAAFSKALDHE